MNTMEFFSFRFTFEFKLLLSYFSLIPKMRYPIMMQSRYLVQSSKFYFSLIITSAILLFSFGCTEDPTAPEGGNGEKPKDTVTIGMDGGTIEKDDIKITIPPGAFDGNHDISVIEIEDDGAFGENTISGSFKIIGLPNSYSETIKIKVRYTSQLSGNSFIALGNNVFDEANSDSSFEYNLFEASDSSGFLISEIPGINLRAIKNTSSKSNENNSSLDMVVKVISSYKEKRSENFVFHYPIVLESFMVNVEKIFEDVFNIISNDLDFSFYPKPKNQTVIIKYLPGEKAVYGWYSLIGGPQQLYFYVDIDHILQNNSDQIKKNLGNIILNSEMIHYKNLGEFEKTIESWAEEFFTDSEFKYPENFDMHFMEPFEGLQGYKDIENSHFIGLSSILKYLTEDEELFGMKGLKKMHSNTNEDTDPIVALLKTINGNVVDWLPDFYKKYLAGEIYELPQNSFINNADYDWNINSVNDTSKLFDPSAPYRDLSAKLFKINLNYSPIDESYDMTLSMSGTNTLDALSLVVFGIQNDETIYLETAHAQDFVIPNLKEYYDNNMRQFLIVLVNGFGVPPYWEESDINLEVKIDDDYEGGAGNGEFDYNYCELQLYVNKFYEREDGSTFEQETIEPLSVDGEMFGNRFVAKREFYVFADTMEVVLSEDGDSILLLDWTSWYRTDSPASTHKTVIEAIGIPVYDSDNGVFKVSGIQTCGNVTHYSYDQNFQGNETTVTSINCNNNSFLEIKLYKRE